jgi:putative ABC transport system permease protein
LRPLPSLRVQDAGFCTHLAADHAIMAGVYHGMLTDLRFSLRLLRRHPGFAFAAIATLAVGIGATTAIFSTVNAAVLRPLPFPHPEDLFAVDTPATDGRFTTGLVSGVEIAHLLTPQGSVVNAAGSGRVDTTILRDDGTTVSAVAYGVTDGFFDMFGMPMAAGRSFTHEEYAPRAPQVAVLSFRVWRDLYGSDRATVGKSMRTVNAPTVTIVGIAAADFDIPHGADFWLNFAITPQATGHGFAGYARVKPGTRPERLQGEMASAMAGIAHDYGMLGKNRRYALTPLADSIVGDLRSTLIVVLGAAALLLLLACVNVTNLMLARGTVRSREMAVRVALGAGRGRIVRQLLTESFVLSTAGTIVGLAMAYIGVRLLLAFGASELPRLDRVPFDARVLGFALATLMATGLLVGFAPALRLAGTSLKTLMNESGRSSTGGGASHRMLKSMIVAEIALAITLVAGAGWLVRSFANLGTADTGFVPQGRLVFDVLLPPARILPPPGGGPVTPGLVSDRLMSWTHDLGDRLRAVGGVTSVATTATLPFGTNRDGVLYIGVHGDPVDPDHPLVARAHRVSQEFFDVMGAKLVAGRGFTADDRPGTTQVAVVNKTFVRRYLGGKNPLTAQFSAGYPEVPAEPLITIVGVVDDLRYVSISQAADPAYYTPQAQSPYFVQTIVVNTALREPTRVAASVRAAVKGLDPLLPVEPRSMSDIVSASLSRQRLGMTLMMLFAVAALALAAVGIYGVISYASAQRMGEVATRMALGATPSNVFWLMMNQGRTLAIVGTVVGVGVAYAAGWAGSSLLYEVRASDPLILFSATALVVGITFLSILVPARRASQVDPSQVLRLD